MWSGAASAQHGPVVQRASPMCGQSEIDLHQSVSHNVIDENVLSVTLNKCVIIVALAECLTVSGERQVLQHTDPVRPVVLR